MNDAKCSTEPNRPEFVKILDSFKDELNKLDENSDVIMGKVHQIHDFKKTLSEPCDKPDSKSGVIGDFEQCLRRIGEINDRLSNIKSGLTELVG